MAKTKIKKIKIKQTKSRIGAPKDQCRTLDALGLRKLNKVVELVDNPAVRGMINKVNHLVTVID
ncbi:MAG: 50S ribosomal protein L30 [Bacteroidaceae bacterium]|jgi:large subunit ribosomal protein L30|nr:50S ribosomal protein L30 [Bacteroidaceae bacterium]